MPNTIRDLYGNDAHKGRDIGVEIELEGANLSVSCDGWVAHNDGSLRANPEAIEYVLSRPYPHREISGLLQNLQRELKANEAKIIPSDRCGVHVHMNCQQLTVSQVLCIICTYLTLEEVLVKWCGDDREGNLFSLRVKDAEDLLSMLISAAVNENFNHFNSEYRYSSVNIASLRKFGSLEFRPLRTPKDFAIIDTWVNILMRIKQFAIGFKHPREIIEMVSSQGFAKFPSIVLGDMAEIVQCKNIGLLVADGVRRVQEIAYVDLVYKKKERPVEQAEAVNPRTNTINWNTVSWRTIPVALDETPVPAPSRWGNFVIHDDPATPNPNPPPPITRAERTRSLEQVTRQYREAASNGEDGRASRLLARYSDLMTAATVD